MFVSNGLRKLIQVRAAQVSLACAALTLGPALRAEDQSLPVEATQPTSALQSHVRDMIAEVADASVDLDLSINRPKLIRGKLEVLRLSNSDPRVAKVNRVGSRDIEILGKQRGASVVTLWMGDGARTRMLQIHVNVKADVAKPDAVAATTEVGREGRQQTIRRVSSQTEAEGPPQLHPTEESETPEVDSTTQAALERDLSESFPRSRVRLFPVANRLIVRGTATSPQEAVRILEFVSRQAQEGEPAGSSRREVAPVGQVVNLLKVHGEPHIRLRVQSVEIQRESLRQFCQQFDLRFDQQTDATWDWSGSAPATMALDTAAFVNYLRVLQTRNLVRFEDEPNHVVASGQSVSLPSKQAAATTLPQAKSPAGARTEQQQPERYVPVLIPSVGANGRFRFEFSAQRLRGPRGESDEAGDTESGRSRSSDLRPGESMIISGLNFRSVTPEKVLLLLITPETMSEQDVESEPLLVPPTRERTSSPYALKRTNTHAASIEAEQRSGKFYLSGQSGYSD